MQESDLRKENHIIARKSNTSGTSYSLTDQRACTVVMGCLWSFNTIGVGMTYALSWCISNVYCFRTFQMLSTEIHLNCTTFWGEMLGSVIIFNWHAMWLLWLCIWLNLVPCFIPFAVFVVVVSCNKVILHCVVVVWHLHIYINKQTKKHPKFHCEHIILFSCQVW